MNHGSAEGRKPEPVVVPTPTEKVRLYFERITERGLAEDVAKLFIRHPELLGIALGKGFDFSRELSASIMFSRMEASPSFALRYSMNGAVAVGILIGWMIGREEGRDA